MTASWSPRTRGTSTESSNFSIRSELRIELPPRRLPLDQLGRRRRHRGFGRAGARQLDERLHQAGDAFEAGLLVVPVAQIDELLVGAQAQGAGVFLDQLDEPRRVGKAVAAQGDDGALRPRLDPLDPGLLAPALDRDD